MSGSMYFDRESRPIPFGRWRELMELDFDDYRRVASTEVEEVWISTVWIGIDMSGVGLPLIFETMIFNDGDLGGEDQWRWATEAAALAGHDQAVEWVRFKLAHDFDAAQG